MSQQQTDTKNTPRIVKYLSELDTRLTSPIHKRIIAAYEKSNPVQAMENELGKILLEVLDEDEN